MKLTEEDLEILGLDLKEYKKDEIEKLLNWECSFTNMEAITREGFVWGDASAHNTVINPRDYTAIATVLFTNIYSICRELKLIDNVFNQWLTHKRVEPGLWVYNFHEFAKEFEKVINGTIELREQRSEKGYTSLFYVSCKPEGGEIEDEQLAKYGHSPEEIIKILRKRNIERLRKLFKEQENKGDEDDNN